MFGRYVKAEFLAAVIQFASMNSKDAPFGLGAIFLLAGLAKSSIALDAFSSAIHHQRQSHRQSRRWVGSERITPPPPHQLAPFHS